LRPDATEGEEETTEVIPLCEDERPVMEADQRVGTGPAPTT